MIYVFCMFIIRSRFTMICKKCWWEYCSTISFVKHMIVIWSLFYSSCMDSFLWIYSMDRFPCQVDILLCLSDVFMKGNQLRRYRRYFFKKVRFQTFPQPRFVFLVIYVWGHAIWVYRSDMKSIQNPNFCCKQFWEKLSFMKEQFIVWCFSAIFLDSFKLCEKFCKS